MARGCGGKCTGPVHRHRRAAQLCRAMPPSKQPMPRQEQNPLIALLKLDFEGFAACCVRREKDDIMVDNWLTGA